MKALLVIDMQQGSFTPATPRYDAAGVVSRINALAARCRALGIPVIYVQHDGSKDLSFLPGTTEWKLLPDLEVASQDWNLQKMANDVFYQSGLHERLRNAGIDELIITGCATDFCVEATVQSALAKDYGITVVKDGHTTGERPHLEAVQVIEHYNWVWQNMIPTNGNITVSTAAAILEQL